MSETKRPATLVVGRGNYFLGNTSIKNDGTSTESSPRWEADPEGAAVVVTYYDTEKNEQIGEAALLPWWDSIGLDNCIREKLGLERRNFPTPEEIYKWLKAWDGRGIDFCEVCEGAFSGYDCRTCPIEVMKSSMGEEA